MSKETVVMMNGSHDYDGNRRVVYEEIGAERARQDEKWGGPEHDDQHDPQTWADILMGRLAKVGEAASNANWGRYRNALIEAAAVAVAGIEAFDRWTCGEHQDSECADAAYDRIEALHDVERLEARVEELENERNKLDDLAELEGAIAWIQGSLDGLPDDDSTYIEVAELREKLRESRATVAKERDRVAELAPETVSRERREALKKAMDERDALQDDRDGVLRQLEVRRELQKGVKIERDKYKEMLDDAFALIRRLENDLFFVTECVGEDGPEDQRLEDCEYHANRGLQRIEDYTIGEGGPLTKKLEDLRAFAREKAKSKCHGDWLRALWEIAGEGSQGVDGE